MTRGKSASRADRLPATPWTRPWQRRADRQQPTLRELMDTAYRKQRAGRLRSAKAAARRGETF